MRNLLTILASALVLTGSTAQAAPVGTNIVVTIRLGQLAQISFSGAGTVSVTGSTVSIASGAVALPAPILAPITSLGPLIVGLSARTISNQAGTFSVGGVTAQGPGERCQGGPTAGTACNAGGGVGGIMGLSGFLNFRSRTVIGAIPLDLNAGLLGQGGATPVPFTIDAALFSTGVGALNTGVNVLTTAGSRGQLTLVSPTYVSAVGNLLPVFTSITFTNVSLPVPEPANLVLVGVGLAVTAVLSLRRRRNDA